MCIALYFAAKFVQYDGIIFPQESTWSKVKGYLHISDKLPSLSEMRKVSLMIFLEQHKDILRNLKFSPTISKLTLPHIINNAWHIYEHQYCKRFSVGNMTGLYSTNADLVKVIF